MRDTALAAFGTIPRWIYIDNATRGVTTRNAFNALRVVLQIGWNGSRANTLLVGTDVYAITLDTNVGLRRIFVTNSSAERLNGHRLDARVRKREHVARIGKYLGLFDLGWRTRFAITLKGRVGREEGTEHGERSVGRPALSLHQPCV